jgi:hypothetical protein
MWGFWLSGAVIGDCLFHCFLDNSTETLGSSIDRRGNTYVTEQSYVQYITGTSKTEEGGASIL